MSKNLLRGAWSQAALAWAAGRYLSFALATTRWTIHGLQHLAPHVDHDSPVIVAFWHERLPLMPALFLHARRLRADLPPVAVLVSRHADGRLIGRLMQRFGTQAIHGSTARGGRDRGGAAGLRQAIAHLRAGGHVTLTRTGRAALAGWPRQAWLSLLA